MDNKKAKALRWIVNQIPDFIPKNNEEKMLMTIKKYCQDAADEIEKLENLNECLISTLNKNKIYYK